MVIVKNIYVSTYVYMWEVAISEKAAMDLKERREWFRCYRAARSVKPCLKEKTNRQKEGKEKKRGK